MLMSHTDIPSARSTQKSIKLEYGLDIKPETYIIATMTTEKVKEFIKNKVLSSLGEKPNEDGIIVLCEDQQADYTRETNRYKQFHKDCEGWNWNSTLAEVARYIIDIYPDYEREDLYEFINFYFEDDTYSSQIEEIIDVFE